MKQFFLSKKGFNRDFSLVKTFVFTVLFLLIGVVSNAQIAVTVTGTAVTSPALAASYPTLSAALTDLNAITAYGTPGSIVFTCTAGTSETAPATGFVIGSATLNPLLSATNTVTIIKAGGTVTVNAGVGTATPSTSTPDGMLSIRGADYITIDGLTFTDSNVANPATMEFGIALFKSSLSDGASNNTIQNCTINMQRINNAAGTSPMIEGAVGILMINSIATAATTALTPTTAAGTNSNNKFYTNSINGGNYGMGLIGFAGATPFTNCDTNNDVGGSSLSTGNSIFNYGGGAITSPAAAIRTLAQYGLNISYNTTDNNNGSGVNHATTLRGIYSNTATSASVTITNNTVTLRGGGTTSAMTAIENVAGSTAASNTISINSNTIRLSYTTATSGVMAAISNTATPAALNINNNDIQGVAAANYPSTGTINLIVGGSPTGTLNIKDNTISNFTLTGNSGTFRGINGGTPTGLYTITGNLVENFSYTTVTSTGSLTGIYNFGSATLMNVNNNIVRNLSTPTSGTLNGVQNNTTGGTFQCKNNQIYNFSTTSGGAGGFSANGITWSNATADISGNIIYAINSTGTTGGTGGTINGIIHSGAATVNGNAIYDLSSNSTNVTITGITTTATGTNTVTNNLIGDLRAPKSTGNVAISGILVSSGTTNNIFHNTVNVASTTSSATTFGTSAIYFSSSSPVNNLRNNIFVNTSSPGPTGGFAAAIRYTTAPTAVNFPATNNNNLYSVGTAAANKVLYCEGSSGAPTNGQQTLSNYKTYISSTLPVSGRESGSVSEVPNFVSIAGSNPITNFLKYDTTIATQIEQGGVLGTGVSGDYALTTRCPGGGCPGAKSAPDMGAWELNGIAADLTGPTITYSPLTNGAVGAGRSFSAVTVTDASGVDGTSGTRPRVYYKKSTDLNEFNDNTNGSAGWKYAEATGSTTPFDFSIDYSLLSGGAGVAVSDVIQYFVVAQDNNGVPNVGINSGLFTGTPTDVELSANFPITGSINTYSIAPALSGTITVPGTYASLTLAGGAFQAINNAIVTGNINIEITDDLLSETGAIALNAFASPHLVKIYPTGSAKIISGALASNALIKLNGADRVTIDGSVGGSGTDRSLTISNTSTASPTAVSIISLGTGLGATDNTIKNCNISTGVSTSTGYGISVGSATPGTAGADNDNVTIQNNNITVATVSIYANGTAAISAGGNNNLLVTGNNVNSNTTIQTQGIQVGNALNSTISLNTISVTSSGSVQPVGISLETGFVSSTVTRNLITNAITTNTGGYGSRGITVGTGTATSALTISNNVIYGVNGSNYSGFTNSSSMGIAIGTIGGSATLTTTTGGVNLYFNSVNMNGNYSYSTGCLTTALYLGSNASALNVQNNIFVNSMNNINGSGTASKNYAIYSVAANTAFTAINNNNYFVSGLQGVLGFIVSDRVNLAAIQTGFGQNTNSVAADPTFTSNTDLTINAGLIASQLESSAALGTGITVDFNGATRPLAGVNGGGTAPDMGAYEFDGVPLSSCATPTAQPTALVLNASGQTAVSGSFTAASPVASNYLVIRTTASSLAATPVDTTTYSVGANLFFGAGGFVESNGSGLTISSTGLTAGTTYYYWVFSFNTGNCVGGPLYFITTPLSGSVTTGALFTSIATGNWEDGTTWNQAGATPNAGSDVIIANTHTVTVNATNALAASVATNATGILNVTGNTLAVSGTAGTGITNAGTIIIDGGTLNLGPQDNSFTNRLLTNNGTLTVTSGTLSIAGRLLVNNSSTFNQSGGNINIDGNAGGNAANSVDASTAIVDLKPSALNSVNLTGGTLTIVDPHANSTASNSLIVTGTIGGPINVTANHTIRFGNGISTDAGGSATNGFRVNTWDTTTGMPFGNVIVEGPTGTNRFVSGTYQQPVIGNVTVNNGGELRIGTIYINGNLTVNTGGTFTNTTSLTMTNSTFLDGSSVTFSPSSNAQVISGGGTFRNLTAAPTANFTALLFNTSNTNGVTFASNNISVSGALTVSGSGSGAVVFGAGKNLTLGGIVTVNAPATLTFESNANLIQTAIGTNVGNITVKRNTSMLRLDYTYWGSPVAAQQLLAFSPNTVVAPISRFYTYDEPTGAFVSVATPGSTNFVAGKGYAIRAPNTFDIAPAVPQAFVGTFTGVPNNGTVNFTGTRTSALLGDNLVGNPYPCTINTATPTGFFAQNPNVGTLYFWTKSNLAAAAGENYASQTSATSVAALAGGPAPSGVIQVGQGFFASLPTTASTIAFNNGMKISNNDNQFFRNANSVEKHFIKLNLTSPTNNFNQIAVGYMTDATSGVDMQIDGLTFGGGANVPTMISSLIGGANYAIQGKGLPFTATDEVALGFKTDTAGNYTLSTESFDGLFANNQDFFIKDNLTGITHNIKQAPYNFVSAVGTFNARFQLVYQNVLGVNNPTLDAALVVFVKNEMINIKSTVAMTAVKIFDLRGRMVYEKSGINTTAIELNDLKTEHQVLLVQITSEGKTVTKKMVY